VAEPGETITHHRNDEEWPPTREFDYRYSHHDHGARGANIMEQAIEGWTVFSGVERPEFLETLDSLLFAHLRNPYDFQSRRREY